MSGPFQVGDVVVCVDGSPFRSPHRRGEVYPFAKGQCLRVAKVWQPDISGEVGLTFTSGPPPKHRAYGASRFRHVERATDEFTAKIRACKPIRVGEVA